MKKLIIVMLLVGCSSAREHNPNAPCIDGQQECIDDVTVNYCNNGILEVRYCATIGEGYHCEYVPTLDKGRCFAPGRHWTSLK